MTWNEPYSGAFLVSFALPDIQFFNQCLLEDI